MTSGLSAPSGWRGCQEPRLRLVPPFVSSAGEDAIGAYELTGNRLNPWQKLVLLDALGERADGRWAAFEVGLVVARQNGKDEILLARELAGLFVWGERLIIHSAHKFDTAMEHLERLATLIHDVPEFAKRIRKVNRSHGLEGITLKSGARIRFRARTRSGGARGYTRAGCLIFNEAMDLPDEIVGSIMPTMSAESMRVPGPQIWLAGSAVDQETMANGLVLTRVRHAGITGGNDRLAYFEWSAEAGADPTDWEARRRANPSLGYQISAEHIEMEFRSPSMSARQFGVERLGQGDWPDTSDDAGRVIGREQWTACEERDRENRIVSGHAFAVDVNPDRTWGSVGVAGQRADGLWQFAVVEHRRRTDWLVDRCVELGDEHPGAPFVVLARGPAGNLIDELRERGLTVVDASGADYGVACSDFFDAIDHRAARYPFPQPELDEALAGARKGTQVENAWTWSRKASTSPDISPLVAVTLALWGAMNAESEFATVLYASDEMPSAEDPEIGPAWRQIGARPPVVVLSQEDTTTCFACSQGGSCPVHARRVERNG